MSTQTVKYTSSSLVYSKTVLYPQLSLTISADFQRDPQIMFVPLLFTLKYLPDYTMYMADSLASFFDGTLFIFIILKLLIQLGVELQLDEM